MIELVIKGMNGELQSLHVDPHATIRDLRIKIAQLFTVNPSQIRLSISNGQNLQLDHDQNTISDYSLSSGSVVIVLISNPTPFQVFVKNEKGQTKTYDIKGGETVDQLMMKIQQKEGVPVDQQRLIFNGQQLDSGRLLEDYNIKPGSTIHMTLRLQVFVKNEKGQTKTYDIKGDETVDQLMMKIRQKEGVPVDQQRLIFNGQQLNSGRLLEDYNIKAGSTIHMTLRLRGG